MIQKLKNSESWQEYAERQLCNTQLEGMQTSTVIMENTMEILRKLKLHLPHNPDYPIPRNRSRANEIIM